MSGEVVCFSQSVNNRHLLERMCRVSEMCVVGYPVGCLCEWYVVVVNGTLSQTSDAAGHQQDRRLEA